MKDRTFIFFACWAIIVASSAKIMYEMGEYGLLMAILLVMSTAVLNQK